MEHYFGRAGGTLPEEEGQNLGFCSVGRKGANWTAGWGLWNYSWTAQMTNLTCFMVMQRVGPWKHRAVRSVIAGNACGKLLYASILVSIYSAIHFSFSPRHTYEVNDIESPHVTGSWASFSSIFLCSDRVVITCSVSLLNINWTHCGSLTQIVSPLRVKMVLRDARGLCSLIEQKYVSQNLILPALLVQSRELMGIGQGTQGNSRAGASWFLCLRSSSCGPWLFLTRSLLFSWLRYYLPLRGEWSLMETLDLKKKCMQWERPRVFLEYSTHPLHRCSLRATMFILTQNKPSNQYQVAYCLVEDKSMK